MNAQLSQTALEGQLVSQREIQTIPRSIFLYAYLILPILLGVVLLDVFYLNSALLPHFGINALLLPIFIFIFNLPHIIASFISFFDGEYVSYYKKHLFLYLPGFLIGTAVLLFVNYELGLVFYFVNDVWHGVKQQTGIALILGAKPGLLHKVWVMLPFVTTSIVYVYLLAPSVYPDVVIPFISPIVLAGTVLFFITMILKIRSSVPKVKMYIFLASIFFVFNYFFVLSGYIFFAILSFRFIHDVSAFAFYINHDYNRNSSTKKNWLYRMFSAIPLPIVILTPLLAFLFAYFIRRVTNGVEIGLSIVILIAMTHFYLESIMWKRNSPHRMHVNVSQ